MWKSLKNCDLAYRMSSTPIRSRVGCHLQNEKVRCLPLRHYSSSTNLRLQGQKCVITGGSGAIGSAIARVFYANGADVLLLARGHDRLNKTVSEIKEERGNPPIGENVITFSTGNIHDESFWKELDKKEPLASWRKVSVLVNAAGISQNGLLFRTSEQQMHDILSTNLLGTMLASKWMGKKLKAPAVNDNSNAFHTGCIINIGSMLGQYGGRGATAYAASKAGIIGFTRALACELASAKIRVNAVQPGYIDSEMTNDVQNLRDIAKKIPLQRLGSPEEVADAVLFLTLNQYANNCVLNLDGGLSAHAD